MQSIFEISNLICKYPNNNQPVLIVENLSISKGELTVIIGLSGAGKSTFLETLGLMNNTLENGSSVQFSHNDNSYNYYELWKENNQAVFSDIRRKYFSFIFQNTNLMPNFTVYDNICITQMLQGYSREAAISNAEKMMETIGLGYISKTKKAYELSGGERQRVAFVRAIVPEFSVLFGDEPTGNLDEYNSSELMQVIRGSINKSNRAAIIVSHNIDLALDFADKIVLITKSKAIGYIKKDDVFHRNDKNGRVLWENSTSIFELTEVRAKLKFNVNI
jgi:ABC-type lipoprotein export system ATPase subunit